MPLVAEAPVAEVPEPPLELCEAFVFTPADCNSAAKSACSVSSASCRLGVAVLPFNEVVLEPTLLEGELLAWLVVTTGVVVTGVVVTGVAELDDVVVDGVVAALEAVDPVAEALVAPLAGGADEGNPWASWLSPDERALAELAPVPSPTAVTELPVEVDCAPAACCRATDSASNSAERNCVSA